MKIVLFLLFTASLSSLETSPANASAAASSLQLSASSRSIMLIDPKSRSGDYAQAFELLKKEKPTLKISIRTADGTAFSNVSDLSLSENGTLLFIKVLSNQGTKSVIVPVEQLSEISYSP